jgi:Tol biopolymer transport system component
MKFKALVMTVVMALGATLLAQDPARERKLQQAIDLLETKGEAARATPLLEDVAKSSDRRLAARGLLYLGQTQERQGKEIARRTYERIVREFGAQQDVVASARERLASLASDTAARRSDLTIRRLRALKDPIDAISSDGTKSLETDWSTGNVLVRDLITGQARPITVAPAMLQTAGRGDQWEEWGEVAIFSPDGTQAAYTWCTTVVKATATTRSRCEGYLRVSRIVDGAPEKARVIYAGASQWTQPYDWSPDGRFIAALIMQPDRSSQLAVITVSDGTVRQLKTLDEAAEPLRMVFSPDGRFLAYDSSRGDRTRNVSDVFVIPTAGGEAQPVASQAARELLVGWSPDGSQVLFTHEHNGTVDLNGVRVVDGQPQGRAVVLKGELGPVGPTRVTPSGALYYTTQSGGGSHIETASVDFSTGAGVMAPEPAGDVSPGTNSAPEWSPDGSSLAYLARRSLGNHTTIVLRSIDNCATLEVRPDLTFFGPLRWGTAPNLVYTIGTDGRGKAGLVSIDLRTARTTFLSQGVLTQLRATPDRRRVHFVRTAGESYQFVERDLATGAEREIFSFNGRKIPAAIQLSPDGSKLYYRLPKEGATAPAPDSALLERDLRSGAERVLLEGRLGAIFLSADGRYIAIPRNDPAEKWRAVTLVATTGEPGVRDLMRVESLVGLNVAAWAPDSRSVLLQKVAGTGPAENRVFDSWWVSVPDGMSRRLPHYLGFPTIHPDGKRVAFQVVGREPRSYEVWVMDHFLPPASTKKQP